MTSRDYGRLADVLLERRRYDRSHPVYTDAQRLAAVATIDRLAHDLADVLAADNPRFNRDRFLIAAGVPR